MKDYRKELAGAIRGNARLHGRIGPLKERISLLESHVRSLIVVADANGRGDDAVVKSAARAVGWGRLPHAEVVRLMMRAKELQP
jgi:hypothetical protein